MDILSILEKQGWTPNKKAMSKGDVELKGSCPWCGEGKDRFIVWPSRLDYMGIIKGFFWCRVCRHKGNAFNLLVDIYGMSVDDAREYLLGSNKELSSCGRNTNHEYKKKSCKFDESPSQDWQIAISSKILFFNKTLKDKTESNEKKETLQFLRERGINDSIIRRTKIGINVRTHEIKVPGYEDSILIPRGIYIPVYGEKNQLIRVKVRRFPSDINENPQYAKYVSIYGSCQKSIGIYKLSGAVSYNNDFIWVTESELDAICMSAQGNAHVIPTSTKSLFPFVLSYCQKYDKNAIFVLDSEPHPLKKDGGILMHPLLKEMLDRGVIETSNYAIAHFSKKDACRVAIHYGVKCVASEMEAMKKRATDFIRS